PAAACRSPQKPSTDIFSHRESGSGIAAPPSLRILQNTVPDSPARNRASHVGSAAVSALSGRDPRIGTSLLPPRDDADLARCGDRPGGQGVVDDGGLLFLVALAGTGSGARAFGAADIADLTVGGVKQRLDLLADETPRAHVARLFLRPDHFRGG